MEIVEMIRRVIPGYHYVDSGEIGMVVYPQPAREGDPVAKPYLLLAPASMRLLKCLGFATRDGSYEGWIAISLNTLDPAVGSMFISPTTYWLAKNVESD